MIETIERILQTIPEVAGYRIVAKTVHSVEVFFVRKQLDMNRAKTVQHFLVTIYRDFTEAGMRYRGSASIRIHPTMSETGLRTALEETTFAAGLVKNPHYPLVKPASVRAGIASNFHQQPLSDWLAPLTAAIFQNDRQRQGWINSAELFLKRIETRIVNSEAVQLQTVSYQAELELITNWREGRAEVELYRELRFASFEPELIAANVQEMLAYSREKALAQPLPELEKFPVLLTGEPVRDFLGYYTVQTSAQSVYEGLSTFKIGNNVQGESPQGDRINLRLDPTLVHSTESMPFDEDGLPLEPVEVIRDGQLLRYWGDQQYAFYLNLPPTGKIINQVFGGGTLTIDELRQEPYLELVAFSDFQMNPITGDFGGEIRLGWYHDGSQTVAVAGGAVSGNIRDVQPNMFFSRELQTLNQFIGPKTIKFANLAVTGASQRGTE